MIELQSVNFVISTTILSVDLFKCHPGLGFIKNTYSATSDLRVMMMYNL